MKYFILIYMLAICIFVGWKIQTRPDIPERQDIHFQMEEVPAKTFENSYSPVTYKRPAFPVPIFNHKSIAKKEYRIGWNSEDVRCLALNIYFEARSEPLKGKVGVSHAVLNRVKSKLFPNSICEVVKESNQFSWYSDGKSDRPKNKHLWELSNIIAEYVLNHHDWDITGGSTFYHADYVSKNKLGKKSFTDKLTKVVKHGKHIFYRIDL